MNKLRTFYHLYAPIRHSSLMTHNIKGRPMNLKLEVRNGKHPENHSLVDFYCQTYMRQDPVVLAAGVSDLSEMREFLSKSLETQRSVLLTDGERGAVVAAISGGPVTYSNVADMRFYADKTMKDDRSSRLVNLWASITSESGLLDHLHLPVLWDVSFLATEPRVQRHGLATFLLLQQRRLASSLGYSALCLECTNPLLAELARRTGFHGVSCRALDSYLDPHGQPWVSAPTHLQVEVFYRVLHDKVNSVHQF